MRRVLVALVLGVLVASGAYALIYLFRWEWHRAIITALFFVAAEVALGLVVLLRRLTRMEQRLDELSQRPDRIGAPLDPAVLAHLHDAAPEPRAPFAWLDPRGGQLSVFLPFLLGVGAIASALAWAVEQLARRTTAPSLERRLARQLAPLALPEGGLVGPQPALAPAPSSGRPLAWALGIAAVVGMAVVAGTGIDRLGDALQSRPDAHEAHVSTLIDVELRGARSAERPEQAAATLWGTCSHVLHGTVGPAEVRDMGGGRVRLLVPAHIGAHAEQRVRGCLQDALVDRIQASVVVLETVPER